MILNDCLVGIEAVLLRCVDVSPEKTHPNCSQTYVRISYIYIISIYIYTGKHIVQHDYLRTDHHLPSLWGFSRRVPLFQNETSKKRWLSRREPPGSESRRSRCRVVTDTFQSFRSADSAGGGNGDLRQIQNKAAVMKT